MALKVLINDLILFRQRSGIAAYTAHLLEHLRMAATDIEVVRFSETLTGAPLKALSRAYETARKSAGEGRVSWAKEVAHKVIGTYTKQMSRLASWPLYHEPDTIPLGIAAPIVTTVHDLSVQLFPQWHPHHRVAKFEESLKEGIARTSAFIADSQATKNDMIRLWGCAAADVHVVHLAPRTEFKELSSALISEAKRRYALPERYLLFLGTIEPRKNVAGLLRAYSRLSPEMRSKTPLVLAGGWGWSSEEVRKAAVAAGVLSLGYVPDADIVAILNGATAMVYPSFYEGFGLPPLEAMACGVPVITTHGGSLAEVIESAALIVDPAREDQLEEAMASLLGQPALAEEYRERGYAHVKKFSWERTAKATAEIYRRVYEKSGA